MRLPDIANVMKDPQRRVTYRIMAYRRLSRAEMIGTIQAHVATNKGRHPKPGTLVMIITTFG